MRLREAPGEETLARLYHELAKLGARAEGRDAPWPYGTPSPEETVVLAAQASRYDARVLWILVEFLATRYDRLDPLKLRRSLATARWPATLGVAFEFARRVSSSEELDDYAAFVLARTPKAPGERFFIHGRAFAGREMRRDVEESLAEYTRWGFFGREEPLAKELGGVARGTLDPSARLGLLRRIAEREGTLTLGEYLAALRGRASPRQARRDLAAAPFLETIGRTRGARYRFVGDPGRDRERAGPGDRRGRPTRGAGPGRRAAAGTSPARTAGHARPNGQPKARKSNGANAPAAGKEVAPGSAPR